MDSETTRTAADLSREEIYALVWERPLNRVGLEIGLDGPRLAKLCDKRQIPYPPPGYWQKKAVGRATDAPQLPPIADQTPILLPVRKVRSTNQHAPVHRATALVPVQMASASPKSVVAIERSAEAIEDGLDSLDKLHPKIRAWIVEHKRTQKERVQENRQRRNDAWSWSKPLLDDLTERDLYRVRASSTLCHAFEKAGANVKDAEIHGKLTFTSQGRDIEVAVREKMSRPIKRSEGEASKWTAYPHRHNAGLTSSGWIRAQITTWLPREQPQWIEGPRKPFSALIPRIVEAVIASVPKLIEWERQREEDRQRYQEEERRRWELRRLQ